MYEPLLESLLNNQEASARSYLARLLSEGTIADYTITHENGNLIAYIKPSKTKEFIRFGSLMESM